MTAARMTYAGPTIPRPETLTEVVFWGVAKSLILLVTKLAVFGGKALGASKSAG